MGIYRKKRLNQTHFCRRQGPHRQINAIVRDDDTLFVIHFPTLKSSFKCIPLACCAWQCVGPSDGIGSFGSIRFIGTLFLPHPFCTHENVSRHDKYCLLGLDFPVARVWGVSVCPVGNSPWYIHMDPCTQFFYFFQFFFSKKPLFIDHKTYFALRT